MTRDALTVAALAVALSWAGPSRAQEPTEAHAAEPMHDAGSLHVTAGELVATVMGCLAEGHGEHHGPVLGQVQIGSISLAGLTTGEGIEWTRARPTGIEAADPKTGVGSESMRARAEYSIGAGAVAIEPFLDQQVRITGVLRSADGAATLHPLNISPVGALCAGGH